MSESPAPLTTPRLVLRAFRESDAAALHTYRGDPEVARYQGYAPMSLPDCEAFAAEMSRAELRRDGTWLQLAIALRESDALIGDIGLRIQGDDAEIGFSVSPAWQRQGLCTEALVALRDWLFATGAIRRLEAITDAQNAASIGVLRRVGMKLESTHVAEFKGAPCVEHVFAMEA